MAAAAETVSDWLCVCAVCVGGMHAPAPAAAAPAPAAAAPRPVVRLSPWVKVGAGMAGGVAEALTLFPMDTIKTRLQMDYRGRYKGIADCGLQMVRHEGGRRALYKGLTPFLSQLVLKYAYRFGSYAWFRRQIGDLADRRDRSAASLPGVHFAAGLAAGVTEAVLIVTPFEVVKTRLQNSRHSMSDPVEMMNRRYKGPVHCAARMVREEGAASLLKGAVPTMIRQGSNQAFNFMVFAALNQRVWGKRDGDGRALASWKVFVNGIVAGAVGPCCNAPM